MMRHLSRKPGDGLLHPCASPRLRILCGSRPATGHHGTPVTPRKCTRFTGGPRHAQRVWLMKFTKVGNVVNTILNHPKTHHFTGVQPSQLFILDIHILSQDHALRWLIDERVMSRYWDPSIGIFTWGPYLTSMYFSSHRSGSSFIFFHAFYDSSVSRIKFLWCQSCRNHRIMFPPIFQDLKSCSSTICCSGSDPCFSLFDQDFRGYLVFWGRY